MKGKNDPASIKKLALPALIVIIAGFVSVCVGVVLLIMRKFLAGGLTAGLGVVVLALGICFGLAVIFLVDKSRRDRALLISEDAYFLQDDYYISFTEGGIQMVNVENRAKELPCVPYAETAVWSYFGYTRPTSKGKLTYTLRFPARYMPDTGKGQDPTKPFVFMDIDESRFPATLERYGIAAIDLAEPLEGTPEKIADYGDIAVYDSGVYLTRLWTNDKHRFLPWDDVLSVTHEGDELLFDCGYERFHARFHAGFFRDLAANYPEKAVPEKGEGEEDGETDAPEEELSAEREDEVPAEEESASEGTMSEEDPFKPHPDGEDSES